MATRTKAAQQSNPSELPKVGLSRINQLLPFIGVSREKWRLLVNEGKAPKPIKLSKGCTVWKCEDVHRWIADPAGFSA